MMICSKINVNATVECLPKEHQGKFQSVMAFNNFWTSFGTLHFSRIVFF